MITETHTESDTPGSARERLLEAAEALIYAGGIHATGVDAIVKQSGTAVLPVAIRGLGELKQRRRNWFRSGEIELRIGQPIRFGLDTTESSITEQLEGEVKRLLEG